MAPNTSLGVYLSLKAALHIAPTALGENFDLVIEESHHRNKVDSPSGTAIFLGRELSDQNNLQMTKV